jgi:hypothetical protein
LTSHRKGFYTLSDQSKKILTGLQKDVRIIKFDKAEDQTLSDEVTNFKTQTRRIASYERIDPQDEAAHGKRESVSR